MLCLAVSVVMLLQLFPPPPEVPALEFREEYPLKLGASHRGRAELEAPDSIVTGERFPVDLRFECTGGLTHVFNPFFNTLIPYSVAIVIYDSEQNYIGNYLARSEWESRTWPTRNDWVAVPGGRSSVGAHLELIAGHVPNTPSASVEHPLPPGTYYLQAIYFNAFIGLNRAEDRIFGPHESRELMHHFDTGELFRSNVVKITLLPPEPRD